MVSEDRATIRREYVTSTGLGVTPARGARMIARRQHRARVAMRVRPPDEVGEVVRDGVRIAYETYGSGPATILVLPTWSVLDAGHGRFQLIDLARHYRVVTFDPRGNGRSDRPEGQAAYAGREFVEDAVAVLDATGTDRAVVVACSTATHWLLGLAAEHPDRVLGAVASGTNLPLAPGHDRPEIGPFHEPQRFTHGWAKFNAEYWRTDFEDFLRFFFSQVWTEKHSERLIDVSVAAGLQTTPDVLIDTVGTNPMTEEEAVALIRRTRSPWLVIHGDGDELQPHARAERLADVSGGSLVTFAGAGHCSGNRDPVRFNLLLREFTDELLGWSPRRSVWTRAQSRPRRVVMVPGNPQALERDRRIADELRTRRPGLEVEWLVGAPLREVLVRAGETVHPAAAQLPATGDEPGEDAFEAWRNDDERHFLSFTILLDIVREHPVDLVVADAAWGIDHHLHENPELKSWSYAWLADAVGWPMGPEADERRRFLVADANAEMIEQAERYPRIRDRSMLFGLIEEVPDAPLGPGLPSARTWAQERFTLVPADAGREISVVADRLAELL